MAFVKPFLATVTAGFGAATAYVVSNQMCDIEPSQGRPNLLLKDLDEIITTNDDTWNHVAKGERDYWFYRRTGSKEPVARLDVRLHTGQIGWLVVFDESMRARGLEEQLVKKAEKEVREYGTATTLWEALVSRDAPWYAKDARFAWKIPAHKGVTGEGWSMDL